MKKGLVIGFVFLVVVIIGIFLFVQFSGDAKTQVEATRESDDDTSAALAQEPTSENSPQEVEASEQPIEESEEEIILPTLTYENAYNGPLYATSEQIGEGYPIEQYMSNLDRNGVNWFIGFFTFLETPAKDALVTSEGFGYVINAVTKYPKRIVPFHNPGLGGAEAEPLLGEELTALYRNNLVASIDIIGGDFFRGLGEIETQEWSGPHNGPNVLELFDLAKMHGIDAMFHPIESKLDGVAELAEAYPDMNFIIHVFRDDLERGRKEIITILQEHDNVYFSIDAAHIAHFNGRDIVYDYERSTLESSKNAFIQVFDERYDTMLTSAVTDYAPLVEGAPNKVMWGTEMGPDYSFEPEVYDRMIKISRELIGQMKPEHQEGLGYKNALEAFGTGTVLTQEIIVLDTSSWVPCTDAQMNECDETCGITSDADADIPENEACFQSCLRTKQCIDNPDEDDDED